MGAEIYMKKIKLNEILKFNFLNIVKIEQFYYKKKCHLSIIDLLFNHGDQAKNIIKSNLV